MQVEDIIRDVSAERLREFIVVQAKYNDELSNAVFIEFTEEKENKKSSSYHTFLQNALKSIYLDEEDYDSEGYENIAVMDKLIEKARKCVQRKKYDEAVIICKACIEEYTRWLSKARDDTFYLFWPEYQSVPFEILKTLAKHTDKKELFDYCMAEVKKKKYEKDGYDDYFHQLLASLAATVNPDTFIALQDKLLEDIKDKSSNEARNILQRKIDFFRQKRQKDKAWALLEENIQIDSFRMEVVKKNIKELHFMEAKKLVAGFFEKQGGKDNYFSRVDNEWNELLLDIAQKEKDIPAVRNLAYGLIEYYFDKKYFMIYKLTFSPAEWPAMREKLFLHYDKGKDFCVSAADLLKAEKDTEGLMNYMGKYLSLSKLVDYYTVFAPAYPEKTLALFQKALGIYAENNTGRFHYESIVVILKKMSHIKGGKEIVVNLMRDYKIRYKNRRAMIEILDKFQKKTGARM